MLHIKILNLFYYNLVSKLVLLLLLWGMYFLKLKKKTLLLYEKRYTECSELCYQNIFIIGLKKTFFNSGFGSKNDYMVYLKDYMKKVVKYLEDNNRAGEVDSFKKNINGVMKGLLGKFKDLQFFQGKSSMLEFSIFPGSETEIARKVVIFIRDEKR